MAVQDSVGGPDVGVKAPAAEKFADPDWTAKGEPRACVPLDRLDTLWINTGTLCNIACRNCYIESSPTNDRLAYITLAETTPFLDEALAAGAREIGFTGGEPFMNPEFPDCLEAALERGFDALVLTNAMAPLQRPAAQSRIADLARRFGAKLVVRVSLDHHSRELHDVERGPGSFVKTLAGIDWLSRQGVALRIAGRTCWNEDEATSREGYARLIGERGWPIDPRSADELMLLPEMDAGYDGPEITTACWGILRLDPRTMMCASSRMVVKRRGAAAPVVLPCTLLPYDPAFEMGATLSEAAGADGGMFAAGAVKLCHKNCAKFCILGGGRCS